MRINRNYGLMARLATENLEDNAVDPTALEPSSPVLDGTVTADEPPVVAEPAPPVEVEAGADSLEADLVEVNSDIVDIQQDEDTIDEATKVADETEDLATALEEITVNGGLDRNGARILNMYVASLNERIGVSANHGTFARESFGGTDDKVKTTKLAAEAFADKAKELWKNIVEMFRAAIAAIANAWNRVFDGAHRMKVRAEKLASAAQNTKGEAGEKTFENQTIAENLHISGTVDAKKAAERIGQEASVLETIAKAAVAFAGQAVSLVESGKSDQLITLAKTAMGPTAQGFAKVSDPASVGIAAPGEGLELMKSEELPGNKAVIAIVCDPNKGFTAAAAAKMGYKLGLFDASKKVADNAKLTVLSTQDVAAVAKQIGMTADALISYKHVQQEAEAAAKKVLAMAEKKAKEPSQEAATKAAEEGNKYEQVKQGANAALAGADARNIAKGAMSLAINATPPLAAYALNAGGYVLQYGEQSLKQYNKAPEAKPAAEPAAA